MAEAQTSHTAKSGCYNVNVRIEGHWFLIQLSAVGRIKLTSEAAGIAVSGGDYIPATVLPAFDCVTEDIVEHLVQDFELRDDVWSRSFLAALVVPAGSVADRGLVNVGVQPTILHLLPESDQPRPGPYVIHRFTGRVFAISKFFPDTQKAFCYGVTELSEPKGIFESTLISDYVAVPSRLYYQKSAEQPLAGERYAVKDLIDVAGCKTGCGSAAWLSVYPPLSENAAVVKQLLDAGAVLVGKTRSGQFAEGADPVQWVDYQCPFNPRGDGYQDPSGSSTGSAVAIGAYTWLDFTLGTDTGGSMRAPAGLIGIYGTRPSTALTNTSGVFPVTPLLDTVGVFARKVSTICEVGMRIISPSTFLPQPNIKPRYRLLYPVRPAGTPSTNTYRWFPYPGEQGEAAAAENHMEKFVQELEAYLGCQRHVFNLNELWEKTKPDGSLSSLDEATGMIYSILTTYSQVHDKMPKLISDYGRQNDGRYPPIDPVVLARQEFGRKLPKEKFDAAVEAKDMFTRWVDEVLLARNDSDVIPILIFPQSFGKPKYRGNPTTPVLFWDKFSTYAFGYLCGCPDYTIPIGEVPYLSAITRKEEFLPISLSIVSRPGYVS
ncbi:MAG: hypothetical protein M1816_006157 [Peltula sp. TS41687]|nr:MAG: hypothetical protein M1816_006157 [Peltula sp. TS41687]